MRRRADGTYYLPGLSKSGRPKGAARATPEGQLSAKARHLLTVLLLTERAMLAGTPAQRRTVRNRGIPWLAATMNAELGSGTASSTLANLEARSLVTCLATGDGRGRRVSHVKLTAPARDVAEYWEKYRQSREQRRRWLAKVSKGGEGDTLGGILASIQQQIKDEDVARVARYSIGNMYQLAALKAVLDEEKHT